MPERVELYRLNAEKCLDLANTFNDTESKRAVLVMANAWLMLAAQREKNIETAPPDEPPPLDPPPKPPPANEPPKPINDPPPLRLNAAKPDNPIQS